MSHPGIEGWFPECIICGMGNLHGVICLDPTCHEFIYESSHDAPVSSSTREHHSHGHFWKTCAACQHDIRADGASWGTYAICTECFASYFAARRLPPASPAEVAQHLSHGWLKLTESGDPVVKPSDDR
ncbi:hypothetical protein [Roseimicrobium sp. ORNL1]|uniref:hypothetical protein n=1 Tax=Roseimicrobium sp. ORNL1 TaxID=2711231 RepID=UPI0013E108B0|nr:hypothetical protein [Roseimicrobium sp. ORNL1]QIF00164.1 hypothetical protein G5S37_01045 [Roseimicrobium sp. ORNL1]